MSFSYGIAGSSPFADYGSRVNVMLCNAVQARWDIDVITPPASDILFLNTWFTGSKDIEIIFRQVYDDKPMFLKSIDWRWEGHITTVDVHTFVRGGGGDIEPPLVGTVAAGIDKIISLNRNTLIPNAWCRLELSQPAPNDTEDDMQTLWHNVTKIKVQYWKILVIPP